MTMKRRYLTWLTAALLAPSTVVLPFVLFAPFKALNLAWGSAFSPDGLDPALPVGQTLITFVGWFLVASPALIVAGLSVIALASRGSPEQHAPSTPIGAPVAAAVATLVSGFLTVSAGGCDGGTCAIDLFFLPPICLWVFLASLAAGKLWRLFRLQQRTGIGS